MKLYAISGLGADERVFKYLNLNADLIPISWIDPLKEESIESYSRRLSTAINTNEPFGLVGVSFGGLIVKELCYLIKPEIAIQISSVEVTKEIPILYRALGKIGFLKHLPKRFFRIPQKLANYFFGSKNRVLLGSILDDSDLTFTKWAMGQLLIWQSHSRYGKMIKIGGSKDKLLPIKDYKNTKLVKDGEHFMIIDQADEISHLINFELKKLSN